MAIRRMIAKLESMSSSYGSKGVKPGKVRTGASRKLKKLVKSMIEAGTDPTGKENNGPTEGKSKKKHDGPKVYASHNGNTQVDILWDITDPAQDAVKSFETRVTNVTSKLEALGGFDFKEAKHNYVVAKQDILDKYSKKYGGEISDNVKAAMLDELHTYAFEYTRHQIVIILVTDEPVEGSRRNQDDGLYYTTIRSKAYYTKGRSTWLSMDVLNVFKAVSSTAEELSTSKKVFVEMHIRMNPATNRYQLVFGELTGSKFNIDY